MTSPASFNTAIRAITYAARDAGHIARTEEPNSDEIAEGLNRLNDLINIWQTQGLKLFLLEDVPQALTASQAAYTFGPAGTTAMTKPLRVEQAYLLDSSNNRKPLDPPMSWQEYVQLGNVTVASRPNSYFVDKQTALLRVILWPPPDATSAADDTLHVVLRKQVTNFTTLTETSMFPIEWFMALHWGLADEWASGQPQAVQDRCKERATGYRQALEDWDVEDASVRYAVEVRRG